jgi:K+-transporting ATPase KdpF subunit
MQVASACRTLAADMVAGPGPRDYARRRWAGKSGRRELSVATCQEPSMISTQNIIGLIGAIGLVIYLFVALTHPDKF